ncbi:MAG: shikimate kinase [Actinomycetales bacterium]
MIVLVGFMGAGKTTVGHILAERLGVPFLDSDLVIERRQRREIKAIFDSDGEAWFRDLEHETIVDLLAGDDVVLALGGGATQRVDTRTALRGHTVIYLRVSLDEALARVGRDEFRPMLQVPDLRGLYERRLPLFDECASITIDTDGRRAEAITLEALEQLPEASGRPDVASTLVTAAGGTYRVWVGEYLLERTSSLLPPLNQCEQAFVVHNAANNHAAQRVSTSLADRGWQVHDLRIDLQVGHWAGAGQVIADIAARQAHRRDLVVAVGGETLCETAGFAASVYHRGMRLALVPSTLAAQCDSAIGGKTAISLPTAHRVAGSYHQPVSVICDVGLAARPDHEDWPDGLAEVAKHALVSDGPVMRLLKTDRGALLQGDLAAVAKAVLASVEFKAAVVAADEREAGERLTLSYGHTFANAIELVHDELPGAVALGMMASAYLAHELGMLDAAGVAVHRELLTGMGLPTSRVVDPDAVIAAMAADKRGTRFVLLRGVGNPVTGVRAPVEAIRVALSRLAQSA